MRVSSGYDRWRPLCGRCSIAVVNRMIAVRYWECIDGGYMMYVVDREYIEVVARSVLYACHSTFISYNQRSVCARKCVLPSSSRS